MSTNAEAATIFARPQTTLGLNDMATLDFGAVGSFRSYSVDTGLNAASTLD